MDAIDCLQLLGELSNEFCELSHGPAARRQDFPAVDYLVIPFGYPENDLLDVTVRELVVPVCAQCVEALSGNAWTLLYCFECSSSQWIYRQKAKNRYRHHVLWLRGCPECTNVFGGLYFNDFPALTGNAEFIGRPGGVIAA